MGRDYEQHTLMHCFYRWFTDTNLQLFEIGLRYWDTFFCRLAPVSVAYPNSNGKSQKPGLNQTFANGYTALADSRKAITFFSILASMSVLSAFTNALPVIFS